MLDPRKKPEDWVNVRDSWLGEGAGESEAADSAISASPGTGEGAGESETAESAISASPGTGEGAGESETAESAISASPGSANTPSEAPAPDSPTEGPGPAPAQASADADDNPVPSSTPPPLPTSVRELPIARAPSEEAFADLMLERLAAGDYEGTLACAEALLRERPTDADALDCAEMSRSELRKLYIARVGSTDRVPRVAMDPVAIASLQLDFRAGFLLSRIDGCTSLDDIAHGGGVAPLDALRILSELYLRRAIVFDL